MTAASSQSFILRYLPKLTPVSELSSGHRDVLARSAELVRNDTELAIQAQDAPRWLIYLAKGEVVLESGRNVIATVRAPSTAAARPLFERDAQLLRVRAGSILIKFDRQQFKTLINKQIRDAIVTHDLELSGQSERIFNAIFEAFQKDQLTVPALPAVALKVRTMLDNDALCTTHSIADVLRKDPVLSARLVQVANSSTYRTETPVDTLPAVINRLGMNTTRNLAIAFSIKSLFKSKQPILKSRMEIFYRKANEVMTLCVALARHVSPEIEDRAMLAGLLHELGTVPILSYIDDCNIQMRSITELNAILDKLNCVIGSWLLANWGMDEELIELPLVCTEWYRAPRNRQLNLSEITTAALLVHAHRHQLPGYPQLADLAIGRALQENGLNVADLSGLLQTLSPMTK